MRSWHSLVDKAARSGGSDKVLTDRITVGEVVDTNDPQQMGRLRVRCPALGDKESELIANIPFAIYASPLAGFGDLTKRGPTNSDDGITGGPVAYGMWNIPKVGAYVLVACIDGDPKHRVWLGCISPQWMTHTLPHGRYIAGTGNNTTSDDFGPEGPLASDESLVYPLYKNLETAFGSERFSKFEWRTRGADRSAAAIVGSDILNKIITEEVDDFNVKINEADGRTRNVTQGYDVSREEPTVKSENTGANLDSQVYAWVTPGFHAMSMDDSEKNCRMRFRTASGHQIILDDTNERIYVATAEGNSYIEMDQNGNIDVFTEKRLSVHAKEDINFETEGAFRVKAAGGVHLNTDGDLRLQSTQDVHMKANNSVYVEAGIQLSGIGSSLVTFESGGDMNVLSASATKIESGNDMNILAGGDILETGTEIHMNGPTAAPADLATAAKESYLTNRTPQHEPWGRIMYINTDNDTGNTQTPEFPYDDPNVGRVELGTSIERNTNWHR